MIRKSYASIERKIHDDLDKYDFTFKNNKKKITKKEKEIVFEIINFIDRYNYRIFDGTGEWKWLQGNKQSKYIEALKNKNHIILCDFFSCMFRNEVTYGYLSPSFEDLKNKKIRYLASSDILCNIDTCFEFTNINNKKELFTYINYGSPYGLQLKNNYILPDTPRHYYYAFKIKQLLSLEKNPSILEIGSGYGGLTKQIWSAYNGNCNIINVDLVPGLLATYFFLKIQNIPVKFVFKLTDIKKNCVNLITSELFYRIKLKNKKLDLIFNSRSLCEMSMRDNKNYIDFIMKSKAKFFYHENSNFLLFPNSKRHIEILSEKFPINLKKFSLINSCITPFSGGDGRYREYIYKKIR